jgi:long-subunit acyl-CoA synthetase (AMP-forming)
MSKGSPELVHEVLAATVARKSDRPAMRVKRGGGWRTVTWGAYARDARRAAKSLVKLGVQPQKGIALVGYNCPEWLIADTGAILAGAVPAGIYTTNSAAQARYIADHCEAKVAFADTPEQAAKFIAEEERLPHLEVVVQMHGKPEEKKTRLRMISWDQFLALGDDVSDADLDARIAAQKPDDVCTLIYTSGTTGDPKAVMITHRNITWTARTVLDTLTFTDNEVTISYLPLSHIAEQMLTVHAPMAMGSLVYFAEALEKLGENLPEVRPTLFLGVPRVWEKIQAKMMAAGANAKPMQRRIATWAKKVGLKGGYAEQRGEKKPRMYRVAKKVVFDKVRARLGLDRARMCVTSAAPISRDTLEFFLSLGIPILEVYGMSECTGPATYMPPDRARTGKAGICLPKPAELKLAEDGEICMRGPHVFKGYLKDEASTRAAIDDEGWLHSGDIGTIDSEGFLQITDRKKDLLITAGGENIAPQVLEGALKAIPVVGQAVVIGDRRKYLTALVTLDPDRVVKEAQVAGSPARTMEDAAKCETFRRHLEKQIDEVNAKLARVQTIKRFTVLPRELSIEGGELTPTMKVKRKVVNQKYATEIEAMYIEAAGSVRKVGAADAHG